MRQFEGYSEIYVKHKRTMTHRLSFLIIVSLLFTFVSACGQKSGSDDSKTEASKKAEPHRYGGWYCPDNFGFVPVDIQKLDEVPAIAHRLPTQDELHNNMSLINVDTKKYPDAKALDMDLPRVASIYSDRKGMSELIIVIQAIVVQEDTVVGYRFVNGGNGSAWITDVNFLSNDEVADKGSQPFFYSTSVLNASPADIWKAVGKTDYFAQLGKKFDEQKFFSSKWNAESQAHLHLDKKGEKASGYVGMVYGNYYLHIDYIRDGFHYSEKMLMIENHDDNTTELFFASGPYPEDFKKQNSNWNKWVQTVKKDSEAE
jgi:hypothetical protein